MKVRSFFLSSLAFIIALSSNAQDTNDHKALKRLSLVGGPSQSRNIGSNNYEPTFGYSLGIGYDQPLHNVFSFNFRVLYERKGSDTKFRLIETEADGSITPITDTYTTKFNYITVYCVPTLHLGPKKNFHVGLGAYYSFLQRLALNIRRTRTYDGLFISERTEYPKNYYNHSYDAGATAQIGYSFNVIDKLTLTLQGYFNSGGVSLYNRSFGQQKNNNFGLLISIQMQ